MEQRTITLFKNTIQSQVTLNQYIYYLNKFKDHYKLKNFDSMISKLDRDQLQIMIEDYVMYLKRKNLSRSAISGPVSALQAFLDINDVEIRWKKIRRFIPKQGKKSGKRAWSTEQIQTMLEFTTKKRSKALIHLLASSGVRVGSIPDMKIGDIAQMPESCRSVRVYANDVEEYYTFLTPEASKALQDYLDKRKDDGEHLDKESPLFRQVYQLGIQPSKPTHRPSLEWILDRILHKSGIRTERNGKRKDIQIAHGFRKRFNTILKTTPGINSNLVEKMMGHSVTIPNDESYLDESINQLFTEFKKAIPELTIDDSIRKQAELDKEKQKNSEIDMVKAQLAQINQKLGITSMALKESTKKFAEEKAESIS